MTTTYKHKLFENKPAKRQNWILSLMPADGKANEVVSPICILPALAKKPEQAGWYFALLQKKHYRIQMKASIKAGNDKDADGNIIVLEESEDEQMEEISNTNEKYVPTRTTQEFIKCALNEDYYGVLDLVPFTVPFYSEDVIEKHYRRQAVAFHPDKSGAKGTERDKKIWLSIQTAKETIMDLSRRRRYDSTLEFDDSIPSAKDIKVEEDFYTLF